jgi:hypothetical protein
LTDSQMVMHRRLRTAFLIAWPVLLGVAIYVAYGRLGFNPTDEGLVNAAAYRILQGQVPHRDFIWPRPVGSAYLHLPELLLPLPGVMTSRAIALGEVVGYSLLFGVLLTDRAPTRWSLAEVLAVAISVLVNLNAFPLMSWYTIDGILLVAIGAVLLRRGLRQRAALTIALAFLALGAATTVKQSFWPAPLFGLVWLSAASSRGGRWTRLLIAVEAAAALPLAYALLVTASGGADELIKQLFSGPVATGRELLTALPNPPLVAALCVATVTLTIMRPAAGASGGSAWWRLIPAGGTAVMIGGVVVTGELARSANWGAILWWLVVTEVVADGLRSRRLEWSGAVLIGAAWMATLSWGMPVPNLVAGSLALFLLHRALPKDDGPNPVVVRLAAAAIALILAVAITPTFAHARTELTYRDRPAAQLTSPLDAVDDDFAGVVTNPVTAEYLEQVRECIRAFPAERVAVIPDNAALYWTLELHNPFPVDWMIPLDITGSEGRIVDATRVLDREGHYLVLFEPIAANKLQNVDRLPSFGETVFRDPQLGEMIRSSLSGAVVRCGAFEGVWSL